MDKKLASQLFDQIALEQYSSALYLSMASAADTQGLLALAADLTKHAREEQEHAFGWAKFCFDRGVMLELRAIDAPPASSSWTVVSLCKAAVEHEEKVTGAIKALRDAAMKAGDPLLEEKAREFLREQIEEEDVAQDRLAMAKVAPDAAALDLLIAKRG